MNGWAPEVVVLLTGLAIASYTDVKDGKIPNRLTGPLVALGLLLGVIGGTPVDAMAGLGIAFAIHFPLWVMGIEKGGDAKLFMAIGALMGWPLALEATWWSALLYLPVGLAVLAAQGKLQNLIASLFWLYAKTRGLEPGPRPPPTMLRTAPIIAAASVMALLTDWLDFTG